MRTATRQTGAALLLAMVILTLVATVAAGMVWQQQRAVDVESAERARLQAGWILTGALDWARLILRGDNNDYDGAPGDEWVNPLAEARLSTFLAADKDNNTDSGLEAFLSGAIVDAQSRWNLRNLVKNGVVDDAELKTLRNLCDAASVPSDTADRMATALASTWAPTGPQAAPAPGAARQTPATVLAPSRVSELTWIGLDPTTVQRLTPFIEILPISTPTPVNVNTASSAVIASVLHIDRASAERLIRARPIKNVTDIKTVLGTATLDDARLSALSVKTDWFDVYGRLRLEQRVLEERSLVRRPAGSGNRITVVRRERRSQVLAGP